jgi:hypothetical protein
MRVKQEEPVNAKKKKLLKSSNGNLKTDMQERRKRTKWIYVEILPK